MDKKKKFQNDPAKFFLFQDKLLTQEERNRAQNYSEKILDQTRCCLCEEKYDLQLRTPRIMVHCGHTFCTACLYLYFKDQRIRCPMCRKVIKRLRVVEVLPINHNIHKELIKTIDNEDIDLENRQLRLPSEVVTEINNKDDTDFPVCPFHAERYQHFVCMTCQKLYCRVCTEELADRNDCNHHITDLYQLKPELVNMIIYNITRIQCDGIDDDEDDDEDDDTED